MQKQAVNVNLDAIANEQCGAELGGGVLCENDRFVKYYELKKISALISPDGREHPIQLEYLKCAQCGATKVFK